ncbi:MAG: shikimate kinase [Bergeyella cardium]
MIISLVGYMGSGKSHISKILSEKLNFKLIDLDKEIVSRYKMPITEMFEKKGELFFRKAEREVLKDVLKTESDLILSLGGGTPVYYNNMEMINSQSESVFLRASVGSLFRRLLRNKSKRVLIARIKDEDLSEFIAKHLFERTPYYNQAKYTVDTDNKSVDEVSEEIIHLLR